MSSNASGCQVNVAGMSQQWNSTFCFYNHVSFESVIKHWSRFLISAFHYFWLSSQWLLRLHYILFYYTWSTRFLIWHGIGLFVHKSQVEILCPCTVSLKLYTAKIFGAVESTTEPSHTPLWDCYLASKTGWPIFQLALFPSKLWSSGGTLESYALFCGWFIMCGGSSRPIGLHKCAFLFSDPHTM